MIPQNALSSSPVVDDIVGGKGQSNNQLIDYETGGIALNNPTGGLSYQIWKAEVLNFREVWISSPNTPRTFVFSSGYSLQSISLSFDQNMRPYIAYMENGIAKFYWFNSLIGGPDILTLPTGSRNPKTSMDDKNSVATDLGTNDIILAYMRGTTLYFRVQRDRYQIEYTLRTGVTGDLLKFGMGENRRLQFVFGTKMTDEELINGELAKGSPISGFTPVTEDDSTSPSSSDLWELDSGD